MSSDRSSKEAGKQSRPTREDKAAHLRRLIETEGKTVGTNTRTVNQLSTYALQQFESTEELRQAAREIKREAIETLPTLIDQVDAAVEANGGQVHLASTAADANEIITGILDS